MSKRRKLNEMSQLFRRGDPTRLVHYEGVFNDRSYHETSDMESHMYPFNVYKGSLAF